VIGVIVANAQTASGSKLPVESSLQGAYVIGESDLLAISVWHEPDLTRVVPVRSDGKISLPLIGELQASGETVEKLRTTITTQLKRFLEDPEVTVSVQEPRSQFFTLVGKVVRPGSFSLGQRLTVLDGLALGGGFKDFAKLGKIYIVRTHRDGSTERLPFDYKKAVGGDLSRNFMLEARDMIIVP
jgi:polysaccharide export outer membrane protein